MTRSTLALIAAATLSLLGCSKPPALPVLSKPIEIVDGAHYDDGGSVSVTLRDANGAQLACTYSQDMFPNDDFEPNELYYGTIDEMYEGDALLIPRGGQDEEQLADYLQDALSRQNEISDAEALDQALAGDDSLWRERQRVEAAEGILQYLQTRIPASLVPVNEQGERLERPIHVPPPSDTR